MVKLYNSQKHLAGELSVFSKNIFPSISKPQLKLIPFILIGMISSESVATSVSVLFLYIILVCFCLI